MTIIIILIILLYLHYVDYMYASAFGKALLLVIDT